MFAPAIGPEHCHKKMSRLIDEPRASDPARPAVASGQGYDDGRKAALPAIPCRYRPRRAEEATFLVETAQSPAETETGRPFRLKWWEGEDSNLAGVNRSDLQSDCDIQDRFALPGGGCGCGIRTRDLKVMSPSRYRCANPRHHPRHQAGDGRLEGRSPSRDLRQHRLRSFPVPTAAISAVVMSCAMGAALHARCQQGPLPLIAAKFSKRLAFLGVPHRSLLRRGPGGTRAPRARI